MAVTMVTTMLYLIWQTLRTAGHLIATSWVFVLGYQQILVLAMQ